MYKLNLHIICTRSVVKFSVPGGKYRTDFSVFNCRYSVFFGIVNTDLGVGIGISKYRISVRYFGIPTQDYCTVHCCSWVFRFDALALSVKLQRRGWLGGWVAGCHTRYCIKTANPIGKIFRPSETPSF